MLMWEEPGSLAGVEGPRAARSGPSWSPAAIGESDVNLRTRSRTEPARWNREGPLARGVGSRRDRRAVSGWMGQGLPRARGCGNWQYLGSGLAGGGSAQTGSVGRGEGQPGLASWEGGGSHVGAERGEWMVGSTSHSPLFHTSSASQPLPAPQPPQPPQTILHLPQLLASPLSCVSLTGPSFPDPGITWTLLGAGARLGLEEGCPDSPC